MVSTCRVRILGVCWDISLVGLSLARGVLCIIVFPLGPRDCSLMGLPDTSFSCLLPVSLGTYVLAGGSARTLGSRPVLVLVLALPFQRCESSVTISALRV